MVDRGEIIPNTNVLLSRMFPACVAVVIDCKVIGVLEL